MGKRRGLDELALGFSRARRQPDLDPGSLDEPWSTYVEHALDGHEHFVRLVEDLPPGPLQEELLDLKPQVELAVDRVWHVAKLGNDISEELPSDETGSLADAVSVARAELDSLQEEFDRVLARTAEISLARTPGGAGRAESKMTSVLDRLEALDAALAEVRSDVLPTNGGTRPSGPSAPGPSAAGSGRCRRHSGVRGGERGVGKFRPVRPFLRFTHPAAVRRGDRPPQ